MLLTVAPVWKQAPFLRLLIPLILGILCEWYFPLPVVARIISATTIIILFLLSQFFRGYVLFRFKWLYGVLLMCMVFVFGSWITYQKNITHQKKWFGHFANDSTTVMVVLNEPLVEKNKSYKAEAAVFAVNRQKDIVHTAGNIIVYFKKDSALLSSLHYGSVLLFNKPMQEIINSGNPGAFDYRRYCLFQSITHQVFLAREDFSIANMTVKPLYWLWLQQSRSNLLRILKQYIPGEREAGIAEALLIGYRDDLDRDLVQAYSNTGVVHVIAISGMHLAMIYGLLIILLKPLQQKKGGRWIAGIIMLTVLWLFTLLSGAGASILRSAVMFSFIVVGESLSKRISVYHTLSASAFFLLCYNPFFLWGVGFQLSYAAVLSIVVFLKPVTNWFYFKNKIADYVWKLMAVTIAAQILTTPLSIYHFHQLPNLFLLSNLVIVPLSGIVLYAEILLCIVSFVPMLATPSGKIIAWLLKLMNNFIQWVDRIPFAVSNNIFVSVFQTLLLYAVIVFASVWFLKKHNGMVKYAVGMVLLFAAFRAVDISLKKKQHKFIVYNVSRYSAMDCVSGGQYLFMGDRFCEQDNFTRNFHLTPSRLSFRLRETDALQDVANLYPYIYFGNKRIIILDSAFVLSSHSHPVDVDIVVFSHNTKARISLVQQAFNPKQYVFDASNAGWKIRQWKNECDSLHLRRHSVQDDGAFILYF